MTKPTFTTSRKMAWVGLWAIVAITGAFIALKLDGASSVATAAVASLAGLVASFMGVTNWRETKKTGYEE